ncbi:MAG: CvpA family protein [Alphaproteobacteria bacterium]|jgi:membrane protein required for colicin V production|nr:CvpA family protein [Alphaproteobacteria bacterium]
MFNLTWLDYSYVAVLLASTVWATIRGGIYETVATLSWVVAAVTARFVSPMLDKLFQGWFGVNESTVGTLVASYFIVFFVILLIVGFFNQKLRDRIQASMMSVTDHTLGVIFGIVRAVVVMGAAYWAALWYFSDTPRMPRWIEDARSRPIMQMTAVKLDEWFFPGPTSKLLLRDIDGTRESKKIFDNLINPRVVDKENAGDKKDVKPSAPAGNEETGYKNSERNALENQLLQIESVANAVEKHEQRRAQQQETK